MIIMGDYLRNLERDATNWEDPPITAMRPRDVYDRLTASGYSVGDALAAMEQIALIQADASMAARRHRD